MIKKNLILWRHADALVLASTEDLDSNRALSPKGLEQAKKMARWMKQHLPKDTLILCSPALRAEQTVAALKRDYQFVKSLNPQASLLEVLAVIEAAEANNLLLIGHQPWIGLLATYLVNGPISAKKSIKMANIKKSAAWWFKHTKPDSQGTPHSPSYKLVAVQHPDFI